MYYVITRNDVLIGVTFDNAYTFNLPDVAIHEMDGIVPDLNTHTWDFENDVFIQNSESLTKLEFLNRFTFTERNNIRTSTDPIVMDIMKLFDAAGYVSVAHANTIQGIQYLALAGILTPARVTQILS